MAKRKRVRAPYGERMIEISMKFWTNNISTKDGYIVKKECWDSGVIRLTTNKAHGIKQNGSPVPFHSLLELPRAIEKVVMTHGIKLRIGSRSQKYLKPAA